MTLSPSWFSDDSDSLRLLAEETAVLEVTELIAECLAQRGVSRAELASRLGVGRSEVTQRLSGKRNLSVRTVGAMLDALGYRMRFDAEDRTRTQPPTRHPIGVAEARPWTKAAHYTPTGSPLRIVKGAA